MFVYMVTWESSVTILYVIAGKIKGRAFSIGKYVFSFTKLRVVNKCDQFIYRDVQNYY